MKLPRTRLALPLLSCSLLLTACPGGPPVVGVPSSPAVLHGSWQGDLAPAVDTREATLGEGRLYVLQAESAPMPYGAFAPPAPAKTTQLLLALDAATGAELARVPLGNTQELRFRPAEGGTLARLVALRVLQETAGPVQWVLSELDPLTLQEQKSTPLPPMQRTYHLSADGRRLTDGPQMLDTRTLQPAPLPEALRAQLQPAPPSEDRFVTWEFGAPFLYVGSRPAGVSGPPTQRYFDPADGQAFGAEARHRSLCAGVTLYGPLDGVRLADGGVALAYPDGSVELRDAPDRLRRVVDLGGCQPHLLRVDGDRLTFAGQSGGQLGTLRVSDGTVLGRRSVASAGWNRVSLVAEDSAVLTRPLWSAAAPVVLERVSGTAWRHEGETHRLRLDTRATWVSKTEYRSAGVAELDGTRLNFTATVSSGSSELRPQGTPMLPLMWQGELRGEDGALVARLRGQHDSRNPVQTVGLELQGRERDFAFGGSLKR